MVEKVVLRILRILRYAFFDTVPPCYLFYGLQLVYFRLSFHTRKTEVLNSLVMKIDAKASKLRDIT